MRERRVLRAPIVCAATLALATALGACGGGGDDDDAGFDVSQRSAPIRCTPLPNAPQQLRVRAKWSKDELRTLRITKLREDSDTSKQQRSDATAVVRVLRPGAERSLLRWSTDDVAVPLTGDGISPEQVRRLKQAAGEFRVVYSTDRDGAFEKVRNVPALRAQVQRTLAVLDQLGKESPKLGKAVEATRELVLSEAFIQSALNLRP